MYVQGYIYIGTYTNHINLLREYNQCTMHINIHEGELNILS